MDADLAGTTVWCQKAPELSKGAIPLGLAISVLLHGLLLVVATSRHSAETRQANDAVPVVVSLRENKQPSVPSTQTAGTAGEAENRTQLTHGLRPSRRKREQHPVPTLANMPSVVSPEVNEASSEKPTLVASTTVAGEEVADGGGVEGDVVAVELSRG